MAPVRTATKMEKAQSENPATEFAQFAEQEDRELAGENLPLTEKHSGTNLIESFTRYLATLYAFRDNTCFWSSFG